MKKLHVLVAEGNYLTREGLARCLEHNEIQVNVCLPDQSSIAAALEEQAADVLILDYFAGNRGATEAYDLIKHFRQLPILGIIDDLETGVIKGGLENGLAGHVLKDCDGEEICDAVKALNSGESFFCGQILDALSSDSSTHLGCDGIRLSEREVEVIAMIAEGMTNKEIAEKLFLSSHTVTTHRKNIMSKLGVNNTAGIVLFAVKSNFISPNRFLFAGARE